MWKAQAFLLQLTSIPAGAETNYAQTTDFVLPEGDSLGQTAEANLIPNI